MAVPTRIINWNNLIGSEGSTGGGVGVECLLMEAERARIRYLATTHTFCFSFSPLGSILLGHRAFSYVYLHVQLVKSTPILLSLFVFSPLPLCACCTELTKILSLSPFSIYLTLFEPNINKKLLLVVQWNRQKTETNDILCH